MDAASLAEAARIADPVERARTLSAVMIESQGLMDAAARYRRQAIADARNQGLTRDQIAAELGVTPPRISQMSKGPKERAPEPPGEEAPRVLVQRALPTPAKVRGSKSLYLMEAERQGLKPERKMLYIGTEPANRYIASVLNVNEEEAVLARRKMFFANDVPVRIATSYFRVDLFGETRLAKPEFVLPTLQAAIQDLGYSFGRADEFVLARKATPFEHETLDLELGEWVVQVLRTSYSTEDTPVHALETICSATRHIFPVGQVAGADEF